MSWDKPMFQAGDVSRAGGLAAMGSKGDTP